MTPTATYRWMTRDDVAEVGQLATRIWHAHYPSVITVAQIDYMLARSYTPEHLLRQMDEGQRFLLAEKSGVIFGFLSVGALETVGNPILRGKTVDGGGYFLHKFYIAPELQGQGVGKALFSALFANMPEIHRIRLQVARKNVNSWNFYLKQGFTIECEADFSVGDGFEMNDYVMEKIIA